MDAVDRSDLDAGVVLDAATADYVGHGVPPGYVVGTGPLDIPIESEAIVKGASSPVRLQPPQELEQPTARSLMGHISNPAEIRREVAALHRERDRLRRSGGD